MTDRRLFIGMPVYNGEAYLREAIESLLGQTLADYDLVISDNASSDGSLDIIQEYAKHDARISVVQQPATVPSRRHFHSLLQRAKLPYFMWAACDDTWHPRFAELLVRAHERNPLLALAFCRYRNTDHEGYPYGPMGEPDYTGSTPLARISRFCRKWDDTIFYGVFRRSAIDGLEFPVWWGPLDRVPLDVAYPPLLYVLARGEYALAGDGALWFRRLHTSKAFSNDTFSGAPIAESAAFAARQLNLEIEAIKQVYRALQSPALAAGAACALLPRISLNVSWNASYAAYCVVRGIVRSASKAG
jgi:hypothetical protein